MYYTICMTKKEYILFFIILGIGVFFRFYHLSSTPPGLYPDEAMNGNNVLEAISTNHFKVFYQENNGREGLFINMQGISVKLFGNKPWALRGVSAVFGSLTIVAIYFLARELFIEDEDKKKRLGKAGTIALVSAFLLATSYWHINFSRIGFRAIMLPLLSAAGFYFILKGLRTRKISGLVWGGIFTGLGFQTYIAFRFVPFILAVPLVWYFVRWIKNKSDGQKALRNILIFLFVTFIAALPIGIYFLQNPANFFGRSSEVSIFAGPSPLKLFVANNIATLGMLTVRGDCNARHNYSCNPELYPLVAVFFLIGLFLMVKDYWSGKYFPKLTLYLLTTWLIFMSLPETLTREGIPHALRAIGLIPPVIIISGFGAWWFLNKMIAWLGRQQTNFPDLAKQIKRIKTNLTILFILALLTIPVITYRLYFIRFASSADAYFGFATETWHLGEYLNNLPVNIQKYVMVNAAGTDVRGIPMPAQPIMFATESFQDSERIRKNIEYILPNELDKINLSSSGDTIIAFIDSGDITLIDAIQKKFPALQKRVPGDYVILTTTVR